MLLSHPTWVRGLKFYVKDLMVSKWAVAPYLGAWIEIDEDFEGG